MKAPLFPASESVVVPYLEEPDDSPFETAIARFAHGILGDGRYEALIDTVEQTHDRCLILFRSTFILWSLDNGSQVLFRAVILIDRNADHRHDVVTSDDCALMVRAFRALELE